MKKYNQLELKSWADKLIYSSDTFCDDLNRKDNALWSIYLRALEYISGHLELMEHKEYTLDDDEIYHFAEQLEIIDNWFASKGIKN